MRSSPNASTGVAEMDQNADDLPAGIETSSPPARLRHQPASPALNSPAPLPLVLKACPQIRDYGPSGRVDSWRDLITATTVVKNMLGISPDAYNDACATLGPETTATVLACLLERAEHIHSAGAYLRDLTRRAKNQSFAVSAMLSARLRAQASGVA